MPDRSIPLFRVSVPHSVDEPLLRTIHSGFVGQGERVDEFERDLAEWLDCRRILSLNSCTSAIHLALHLANVQPGDEVITTPVTCFATIAPIVHLKGKVVWADVNPKTGNIDAPSVGEKLSGKTKAVIAVNWAGYPCDMDELQFHCDRVGAKLIVDNAHGFGSAYHGRRVFGDMTCFSFQAIKHMTTFDGGALWCANDKDHERAKLLRWYGMDRSDKTKVALRCQDDVKEAGYKFHMNDVNATVGIEQLKYASGLIAAHQRNAQKYRDAFTKNEGDQPRNLHYKLNDRSSAYWVYTMTHPERDAVVAYLNSVGIGANRVHVRNDLHSCFRQFRDGQLYGVEHFDAAQFSIPCGWWLSEDDTDYIIHHVQHAHERIKQHASV